MARVASTVCLLVIALAAAQRSAPAQPPQRGDAGWVVLSIEQYRALHDKAYPPARPATPPAVAATVSRVEYDLVVDGQAATGQVRLTADVFKDDWVFVPVPPELHVRQATLQGRAIALVSEAGAGRDAARSVLLSRPGRQVIVLDVTIPVASKAGVESVSLPPASAPVQRALVTIRSADAALNVSGGLVEQRTAVVSPPSTRFAVAGRPGEPLVLSWGRRAAAPASTRPLRLRGSVTQLVGLGEDAAQVSAQVTLDVADGATESATLRLPANFSVGQVTGPLVADWDARGGNQLLVTLLEPVERTTTFTVTGEARTPRDGKLSVPLLRLAGAERETGGVAVEVLGAGEIRDQSARGLDAADASDLSEAIAARRSPALVAFRYRAQASDAERALDVTVARYTPQAVLLANVDEARYRALLTEDGKAMVEARFAVRNSQRSFLGISLPRDAAVWTASVDGRPVRPGRSAEGALLLPILRDRGEAAARSLVHLLYVTTAPAWPADGAVSVDLPVLDLPVSRTGLVLHYPPTFRVKVEPGAFREEEYVPPATDTLRGEAGGGRRAPAAAPAGVAKDEKGTVEARGLADSYQRVAGGQARPGLLPVTMPFPSFGPSRFLAGELTPEGKTVQMRLTVKREGK